MNPPDRSSAAPHEGARQAVGEWQRLSALYEEVDALDDGPAQARLAELEAEDHPLLKPLRQMLAARERVQHSDFLGTPPPLPNAPEPTLLKPWSAGSRVGPYRLQRHLGSGGMAEVWLAERADGAFQRQLALKLLFRHADSTSRDSFAQRFARERDILASLNHPNIAALHDAGVTSDGQPWLALEYVEGEPITHWCNRQALDIRARVQLFRQVLRAVQHAHANLIIHRDIKPGNILVSDRGEVRLLDFGIAKLQEAEGGALADTELTRLSGRPLTVPYASPEQLSGLPLTTACDVYSLGVVLYELLCGERPYELKVESAGRLEQAILEAEPRPMSRRALSDAVAAARSTTPKALRRALATELDAVVLRMLAKQPGARYGSVESVLADIDRWCQGEPVLARAPSTVYRVRKFVARHPLGVGFGAAAGVSLVAVALVAVFLGLQARQEAARSVAATQFLFDMFRNADPDNSQGIGPAASLLLDKGRQTVLGTLGGQPLLQAELLHKIAEVQMARGEYPKAEDAIAAAIRIDRVEGQGKGEAKALVLQAMISFYMGDLQRSSRLLAQATTGHSFVVNDREFAMNSSIVRALLDRAAGELTRAREDFNVALIASAEIFGENDARTVAVLNDLAIVEAQAKDFPQALAHVDQSIQRIRNTPNAQPIALLNANTERASIEQQAGRYSIALGHLESLVTDCERWLDRNSDNCRQARQRQAVVLLTLGRGQDAEALMPALKSQSNDDASPSREAEALLTACRVRALSATNSSKTEFCERARQLGESGPEVELAGGLKLAAMLVYAEATLREGNLTGALDSLDKAEARFGTDRAVWQRFSGRLHLLRGVAFLGMDRKTEAIYSLRQALREQAAISGADHPMTMLVGANLARALWASGEVSEANTLVASAFSIVLEALGADSPTFKSFKRCRDQMQMSPSGDTNRLNLTDLLV